MMKMISVRIKRRFLFNILLLITNNISNNGTERKINEYSKFIPLSTSLNEYNDSIEI